MILPKFVYTRAESTDDAVRLFQTFGGKGLYFAGGTDIIPRLKLRLHTPHALIDLKHIEELRGVTVGNGQVSIGAYKLGTLIKVSEELLNDSVFNLEAYISREFARRIGNKEEDAFFTGDGSGKPTGILAATGGAQLGVTTAGATAVTMDEVLDLFYSLKAPYRNKAVFVMNDATVKAIRKLKDGQGQYLWQPSLQAGTPDTILNRPVYTSAYVPTIAAAAKTIVFGDFSYYWVADRQGRVFKRLNELFAVTGQVGFVATQRVDGKLILPEAIKVLQQKA